jgi:hypothetical protein
MMLGQPTKLSSQFRLTYSALQFLPLLHFPFPTWLIPLIVPQT